ncbi:hypothetical protein [Bartonella schoenbuchensis]|uniref:Uncharacterized protein n=2 Tax=Bartonella schoenbuchensis TaxID=165694 RepID=A0A1S6XQS3_BARSR|nr:hypothetical protein [Bartonella schoenbuchensis]AQX30906.1 hypothetical protein BscR1v2_009760 [Bartonella schoenbuchensis R1]CDP80267.1 hypothetical protein BN1046_01188 [Bartonella schoenbuchensis]
MRFFRYFTLGVFLLLGTGGQSLAAKQTTIQKTELLNLVVDINNAIKDRNFAIVSAHMPDRLYKEMAHRLNTTEDDLRNNLLKQLHTQFENLPSDAYYLDEIKIDYRQTDNGSFYALIPTTLKTEDRIIHYKTLAIFDNNRWYLIYGGQKTIQNPVFLEIYPDFDGINLPKETVIKR